MDQKSRLSADITTGEQNQISFLGSVHAGKVVAPLREGETANVRGLAPEDSCAHDMLVLIRWHDRNVPFLYPGCLLTPPRTVRSIFRTLYAVCSAFVEVKTRNRDPSR
jgi:hypothetical protein